MFTSRVITVAFITMFAAAGLFLFFDKRGLIATAKTILVIGLVASLYCVAAGIFLLTDWQDPFAAADPQLLTKASASHGGKGGFVVIAIRFWPYVLVGLGGYFAYQILSMLKLMRPSRSHT